MSTHYYISAYSLYNTALGYPCSPPQRDSPVLSSLGSVASAGLRGNLSPVASRHMPSEESCGSMQDNAVDETYSIYKVSRCALIAFLLASIAILRHPILLTL